MIKIILLRKESQYIGFNIEGHALDRMTIENTIGESYDMICNSVSVLSQSVIIGMQEVIKLNVKENIKDGYLSIDISSLNIDEIQSAQVLFQTFEKSLESLAKGIDASFGKNARNKYIKIVIKEVQQAC